MVLVFLHDTNLKTFYVQDYLFPLKIKAIILLLIRNFLLKPIHAPLGGFKNINTVNTEICMTWIYFRFCSMVTGKCVKILLISPLFTFYFFFFKGMCIKPGIENESCIIFHMSKIYRN